MATEEEVLERFLKHKSLDSWIADHIMELSPCSKWKPISLGSAGGFSYMLEHPKETMDEYLDKYYGKEEPHRTISEVYGHPCEHGKGGCYPRAQGPPEYSSNMNFALEVVERLRKDGVYLEIASSIRGYQVSNYTDEGLPLNGWESKKVWHEGTDLPMVICKVVRKMWENKKWK